MKLGITTVIGILLAASHSGFIQADSGLPADEPHNAEWAQKLWNSFQPRQGEVKLADDVATLNVPDTFYYLNPKDSQTVLVDVWGNPPGPPILGMLFPSGSTPFDDGGWTVTIEYEEDGWVSDEDADAIDYNELLAQMKESTQDESEERVAQGYESIELIGWAAAPFYDKTTHKMHWAKEFKFGREDATTLNYNIRVLGRQGVLILNFIANMAEKPEIDLQVGTVLAMAEFDQGQRYEDFDPSIDKVAAYGIGALVAGKVLAKTGLLVAAAIFLKKFWIILLVGFGIVTSRLFRGFAGHKGA